MALETQGYQFQAPIPDLSREHPLSSLKALTFSGGGQSPVAIAPLAGWKVESAHPENVAIGATQGAGAIGQGITAAYLSKQAKKEEADKLKKAQDREDSLLGQKYKEEEKLVGLRGKYALDHAELMQGIKDRIPKQSQTEKAFTDLGLPPLSGGDSSESSLPPSSEVEPINTGLDFKGLSTEEIDGSGQPAPSELNLDNKPLGDITSPVPLAAAPSATGEQALNALKNIDWSKMTANLGAGTGAGASSVSIPLSQPDWLRSPKAVTKSLSNLGGVDNVDLPLQDQYFAGMQKGLAQAKAPTIPAYERQMHHNYKALRDDEAQNIWNYAKSRGMQDVELPVLTGLGGGMTEVKWPTATEVKKAAAFGYLGEKKFKQKEEFKEIDSFNNSVDRFNTDPSLTKAKEKLKPVIETFMGDLTELNRMGESYGNRSVLDQSLIDQYVRFATGHVPTHNQTEMLTSNRPLFDKLKTLAFKNVPASSESLLKPEERKQMANSIVKVLNMEHQGLNTKIENEQRIVNKLKSQQIGEENKPHRFPILKTDEDVEKEVSSAEKELEKAWGDGKNKTPKDPEAYKQAIQKHKKAIADLEIAKSGVPSNLDDLSKYGEEIDGVYYPAGWSGRLIYHPSPQQPINTDGVQE